jgi:hypothetical protein
LAQQAQAKRARSPAEAAGAEVEFEVGGWFPRPAERQYATPKMQGDVEVWIRSQPLLTWNRLLQRDCCVLATQAGFQRMTQLVQRAARTAGVRLPGAMARKWWDDEQRQNINAGNGAVGTAAAGRPLRRDN